MKAIVHVAPGRLEWQDWPLPQPGPGQARIRTLACGICATDLEMIAGWNRTGFPAIPGHEWSGVVDAWDPAAMRPCWASRASPKTCWPTAAKWVSSIRAGMASTC